MRILIFIITIFVSVSIQAAELTAQQLNDYCSETDKGLLGQAFDVQKSETCRGYMMGFFDSMIIANQFSGKPLFCVPPSLPKSNNTKILSAWIEQNSKIAETTTAAVALFSAYSKAFSCNKK